VPVSRSEPLTPHCACFRGPGLGSTVDGAPHHPAGAGNLPGNTTTSAITGGTGDYTRASGTLSSKSSNSGGKTILTVIPEVAQSLGISRAKVYELIAAEDLPSVRIGGCSRVRSADLAVFVNELKSPAPRLREDD
jgi:excisionase family DNA binding protein